MSHPVIGVVVQTLEPIPRLDVPLSWTVGQRYVGALANAGGLPWLVPLLDDEKLLRGIYDRLDGLYLVGGVDVDPSQYRQPRHPLCGRTDPARDAAEIRLARWAMEDGKPLFGVCRGLQMINVAAGGTLYQDLREQHSRTLKHDFFSAQERDTPIHAVRIAVDSRLGQSLGCEEMPVNSMHHQGIRELAPGLKATAWAPDGVIEAIEGAGNAFLLAVQWHPEEMIDRPEMKRLYETFVAEARSSAASKKPTRRAADAAAFTH